MIIKAFNRLVAVLLLSVTFMGTANANLIKGYFDDIWIQTTSARVFEGQRRGGLIGGSVVARIPNRSFSLISFTEPRFEAGCGGIDMNAGAFTFIDGQELIELLKQIGQQAKALLFKIAVDAINNMLGDLIDQFQTKVQAMNSLLSNTCAIAQGVVGLASPFERDRTEASDFWQNQFDKAASVISDDYEGRRKSWEEGKKRFKDLPEDVKNANPHVGNLTFRAALFSRSLAEVQFGALSGGSTNKADNRVPAAILMMNVFGTEIVNYDKDKECAPSNQPEGGDGEAQQGTGTNTQTRDANADCQRVVDAMPGPSITKVSDLANPGSLSIWMCLDEAEPSGSNETKDWKDFMSAFATSPPGAKACTDVDREYPMVKFFAGTQSMINYLLFGVEKAQLEANDKKDSNKGLVKFLQGNASAVDDKIKMALANLDTPILGILRRVQRNPDAVAQLAELVAKPLSDREALRIAESLDRAAGGLFIAVEGSDKSIAMPAEFKENRKAWQQSIALTYQEVGGINWMQKMKVMTDFADGVYKSLPTSPVAIGQNSRQ